MDKINLIAIAIPIFFALIAIEIWVARRQGLDVYRFNDGITDLSCGITQQVTGVFIKVIPVAVYVFVYDHFRAFEIDGLGAQIVAFLGVDFMYYWWHRWTHRVNIGWATHVVHHQSEDYNLAVALRQSLTSSISSLPFYLPLAILGISPIVFLTHSALNTLYQFWIHTETIDRIGPLEWVLNTPSHHRVHHGINPEYLDKNYAGVLIIWDRIFGTFAPEVKQVVYGTVKPMGSFNPLWANVWYFAMLYRDSIGAKTAYESAKVWWAPPGYRPEGLEPYPEPGDVDRSQQKKYDPETPIGLSRYIFLHFVPLGVSVFLMLWFEDSAGFVTLFLAMTLIVATTVSWGGLFERKPWALPLELGRVAVIGVFITWLVAGDAGLIGLLVVTWVAVVASMGWVLSYRDLFTEA